MQPRLLEDLIMKRVLTLLSVILTCCSFNATAEWLLNNNQSSINFVSIKKQDIAELHRFANLKGRLIEHGRGEVVIDLASVNTGIEVRDTRMKEMLFETERFGKAIINVDVGRMFMMEMEQGKPYPKTIQGSIEMHGVTKSFHVATTIISYDKDNILISSIHPVIINASDFGFDEGIAKLTEVAGLPSISKAVPVSFVLTFTRK